MGYIAITTPKLKWQMDEGRSVASVGDETPPRFCFHIVIMVIMALRRCRTLNVIARH